MTATNRTSILAATTIAFALAAPVAQAATWGHSGTASACYTSSITNATNVQNAGTCVVTASGDGAATAGNAELRAYSNSRSSNRWRAASLTDQGSSSGYGVNNRQSADVGEGSSPEHAIDNDYYIDAVAYKFANSTMLKNVTLGWSQNDADFSVLYYDGDGDAFAAMANWGTGAADFAASGWKLLSHYNVTAAGNTDIPVTLNNNTVSSSFWMITAYSSAFGSTGSASSGKDYFKLLSVSGTRTDPPRQEVSEPGALALAGISLLGLFALRRRNKL